MLGIGKLSFLWLTAALVLVWTLRASADSMGDLNSTVWGSGMSYVPPADLTGWFFNSDGPPASAFPAAPDPSLPWTSAANIATLNNWLGVAADPGDNPATLDRLSRQG